MSYVSLPAPRWMKVVAFVIDIFLVNLILLWPLESLVEVDNIAEISQIPESTVLIIASASSLIFLLYRVLFELYLGQTLGMMVMNIRTVVPDFFTGVVRNLYVVPVFPIPLLWVVELYYFMRYNEQWLEKITKTKSEILGSYR